MIWPCSALILIGFFIGSDGFYCCRLIVRDPFSRQITVTRLLYLQIWLCYTALFSLRKTHCGLRRYCQLPIHHLLTFLRYMPHAPDRLSLDLIFRQQDTFGFEVLLRCFSFYKVFPSAQLPESHFPFSFCWLMLLPLTFCLTSCFVELPMIKIKDHFVETSEMFYINVSSGNSLPIRVRTPALSLLA